MKFSLFIFGSLIFHGIILSLLQSNRLPAALPDESRPNFINLQVAKKPKPENTTVTEGPRLSRPPSRKRTKDADILESSKVSQENPLLYSELFPNSSVTSADSEFTSGENSGDGDVPIELALENAPALLNLAKDMSQNFEIPDSLKLSQPNATVSIRLRKSGASWKTVEVSGDSYYRALFFEFLNAYLEKGHTLLLLEKVEVSNVRLFFSLRAVSKSNEMVKPLNIKVMSNKIFLEYNHILDEKYWQAIGAFNSPDGRGVVGIDFVGLGSLLFQNAPDHDKYLQYLRASPAYISPIKER